MAKIYRDDVAKSNYYLDMHQAINLRLPLNFPGGGFFFLGR